MFKNKINHFVVILSVIFFVGLSNLSFSSPNNNFYTPYSTISYFIQHINEKNYYPEKAAETFNIENGRTDSLESLAISLKKILDGRGLMIELAKVPHDTNYFDSTTGLQQYTLFEQLPDIYLIKSNNRWYFSKHTIGMIPIIYQSMYPYNVQQIVNLLPHFFQNNFLFLKLWQWLGIVILLILGFLVYLIFDKIILYILFRLWKKFINKDVDISQLSRISHPLATLLILVLLKNLLTLLELPIGFTFYSNIVLTVVISFLFFYMLYRITDYISEFFARYAEKTENKLDDKIVPIVRKFSKVVIVIFAIIYIIKNIGVDITPLIAGVSIGSLALALAAQETLKNLFGSLTLFSDKVFQVGDWIIAEDADGTVEEIGMRSTKIRTFNDSIIIIPNGKLADMKINNMGRRRYRRFKNLISLKFSTSLDKINIFIDELKKYLEDHPNVLNTYKRVFFHNMSDSSLQILFDVFLTVPDYESELRVRQQILSDIMKIAEKLDVDFAFPSQVLYFNSLEGPQG